MVKRVVVCLCINNPFSVYLFISVIVVYKEALYSFFRAVAFINININRSGLVICKGNYIKAGTLEGEFRLCVLSVRVYGYFLCAVHGEHCAVIISWVVAVNSFVAKLAERLLCGGVCVALHIPFAHSIAFSGLRKCSFLRGAAYIVEINEAVLIVNGGGGDHGHGGVIIVLIILQIGLCRIGKLLRTIHLHILGRIAYLCAVDLGGTVGALELAGADEAIGKRRRTRYIRHNLCQTGNLSAIAQNIVGKNTYVNRQAEIDDDRIRYTADLVLDCKPDDGMGIIITGILCA